jgi:outer membrane protein assembly factor BamD (BamD/ComL family)
MSGSKLIFKGFVCTLAAMAISILAFAAQGPTRGPVEPLRDQTMEITAKHNLEIARWYITKRKAYEGGRDRLQEIIDAYPEFSRMDEVVFWMGEVSLKLKKNDKAEDFYNKLVKEYPASEFVKKARERLEELKVDTEKK